MAILHFCLSFFFTSWVFAPGYTQPIMTWPLAFADPAYDIIKQTAEGGKVGCRKEIGDLNQHLGYQAIKFVGDRRSYVDLRVVSGSAGTLGDFAFVLTVKACSTIGGTVFNYQQDTGPIVSRRVIRDIVLWCNTTHVIVDVISVTGDSLGQIVSEQDMGGNEWVNLALAYDESNPELKLMKSQSDLGLVRLSGIGTNPRLGLPGTLRIGGRLNGTSSQAFAGQAICCVMYDSKIANGDVMNAVDECYSGIWPSSYPSTPGKNLGS
ncbi:uncharacterized protein LOC127835944 [Dreissena polymorpha]|uniref:uncharacterized protein LOC127835944 n=1 Tax=Dreissena polymorpha TaxID=45954 RepID=UPI002264B025|nr:uncharacterized protein LOC127835944 [Dreissena polymorpha]